MKTDTHASYDFYDIKKFTEVLEESRMMVPDAQRRFQQALEDLQQCVVDVVDPELSNTEWYQTARAILFETQTTKNSGATETTTTPIDGQVTITTTTTVEDETDEF